MLPLSTAEPEWDRVGCAVLEEEPLPVRLC